MVEFILPASFQPLEFLSGRLMLRADDARWLISTILRKTADRDTDIWGCEDLEAARGEANQLHRPHGHRADTAEQTWDQRRPIADQRRRSLRAAIDRHREQILQSQLRDSTLTRTSPAPTMHRIAVRQALVELGLLTVTRRSITLPIKTKRLAKIM